ncbi:hypothetical protein [Corallococcus sp. Z5C101001]|uniref:hypothetical protein n=1 Tax=Corallococcus sp. Z5C101001 TaxID=2596829 RepID=UPI00117C0B3F|nr:hypothetical protein [Corallococcus sp. Z5C101001]TSC34441.1 hypothetical protein FOF48_05320 [Corallococcus sp. Z5C101001]
MHDILRRMVLTALLATSATAWAEPPVSPKATVSPVPLIALAPGKVLYIDPRGTRTLADCEKVEERRMLGGAEKGKLFRETEPCSLWYLAVHPPTGRWAMAVSVTGDIASTRLVSITLSGRRVDVPTDKAGRVKEGNLLVMGDLDGVVAITPGVPAQWTSNHVNHSQRPEQFTADGSRVLVANGTVTTAEWWSWSFGTRPEGIRVLPAQVTDTASNHLVLGESRTVMRHERGGVRIATLDATGTKPWKLGPVMKQKRRGLLTPVVLGDSMVFYREGVFDEGGCDESNPGTYRRVDLRTGQERVWRTHETYCSGHEFAAASARRRTVYFIESNSYSDGIPRLYEYSLDRDEVRELKAQGMEGAHDISADGRTLLLHARGGVVSVHDTDTDESTWLMNLEKVTDAGLLDLR